MSQTASELQDSWNELSDAAHSSGTGESTVSTQASYDPLEPPPLEYRRPKKNWRVKRGAMPQWYKQRQGIRTRALSGAARVARFRPPGAKAGR